jgi:hypothetical protein
MKLLMFVVISAAELKRKLHQMPSLGRLKEVSLVAVHTILRSGPYRVYAKIDACFCSWRYAEVFPTGANQEK